jgi:hypothetical protein
MTKVITKEFLMERRTFLKWSAAAAVAGSVIDIDAALAAGECKAVGDISSAASSVLTKTPSNAGKELLYWIDGPMNTGLPGYNAAAGLQTLQTRARLSCTMNMLHTAASFVESVSLVEDQAGSKTLIAQTFYGPSAGTITGRAPYTVFENLELDYNKIYQILYVKNVGGMITVYQHTIENPEPSRFDYKHAPGELSQQAESFMPDLVGELRESNRYRFTSDRTKTGYVTTPFGTTRPGHHARAHIKNIVTSGDNKGDFEIEIDFMHGDSSDAHYMRYFLVLDPVGRVLGGVRRIHGDGLDAQNMRKVLVKRGFHTPKHSTSPATLEKKYEYDGKEYLELHGKRITGTEENPTSVDINSLTDKQKELYINSLSILDCPFISIYTDDRHHAIARFSIRLR